MRDTAEDLIDKAANRYTVISVLVCTVFHRGRGVRGASLLRHVSDDKLLCRRACGRLVLYISKFTPKCRQMFDAFCATYYQFVPDDELRTAMYNKAQPDEGPSARDGRKDGFHPLSFKDKD